MKYMQPKTYNGKQYLWMPKTSPCFGDHEWKIILYNGGRAYRCVHCTWTLELRR